jgi:hypothetical protein
MIASDGKSIYWLSYRDGHDIEVGVIGSLTQYNKFHCLQLPPSHTLVYF